MWHRARERVNITALPRGFQGSKWRKEEWTKARVTNKNLVIKADRNMVGMPLPVLRTDN